MAGRDRTVPFFAEPRPDEVVSNEGRRLDGRAYEEFRKVFLKTGVNSQAAGSAYAEFGRTKVMVGVYGPRQSDRRAPYSESGRIDVDLKVASFASRQRKSFHQTPEEREMSATVQTAIRGVVATDTFPKAVLDVYCTVLEAGGSEVAVAICAAALAIADAGLDMTDLVTACSVSKVHGLLLLDPLEQETRREDAGLTVSTSGITGEVTEIVSRGRWTDAELKEALELCLGGCAQLDVAGRQVLKEAAAAKVVERGGEQGS